MDETTFDVGQVLFCDEYKITDKITVRQCTVGDIFKLGEGRYFHILSTLTAIPSDAKSVLWDAGTDWMELDDVEFFAMMVRTLSKEETEVFIPNVDFKKFELYKKDDGEILFADRVNCIVIDKFVHQRILDVLCGVHKIKKRVDKPKGRIAKQWLLEEDRKNRELNAGKKYEATLLPLCSAMVNTAGFKYNYSTVRDLPFGQFMDSVARIQIIDSSKSLLQGIYAGNVDASKIDKKSLDWTRSL